MQQITVKMAVLAAYGKMPAEFSALDIISTTRKITGRPMLMDSSITATLRRLRSEGFIDYRVKDKKKAQYSKMYHAVQGKLRFI